MSKILELPEDRNERIKILKKELAELTKLKVQEMIVESVLSAFEDEDVVRSVAHHKLPNPNSVYINHVYESDDEGGSCPYLSSIAFYDDKEEEIDYEVEVINDDNSSKSNWSVYDILRDIIGDHSYDWLRDLVEYFDDDDDGFEFYLN